AGIREAEDEIEKIGVERTKSAISDADFVVAVIEANSAWPLEEKGLLDQFPINIFVINKCDFGVRLSGLAKNILASKAPVIYTSALTGEGISELRQAIHQQLVSESQGSRENAIITNERHYRELEQALEFLRRAKSDLASGFTEEVALANLH